MATSFLPYQSRAEASPPSSHGGARECDGDWPTPSDKTKLDRSTRCLCYCEHGCRVLTGNRVAQPPNPRRGAGPWCPNVSGEKSPPTGGLLPPLRRLPTAPRRRDKAPSPGAPILARRLHRLGSGGGFRLLSVLNDGSNGGGDLLAKWWTANSRVRRGLRPRTYTQGTTRGRCTEAEISGERQHEASAVRAKRPAWLLGKGVARLTSGAHEAAADAHTGTGSWAHGVGANARAGPI
jgi:hypothetical protein